MRKAALAVVGLCLVANGASAQDSGKLALLLPNLYGPGGLFVNSEARLPDGSTHSAHFNSAFQAEFAQFNIALASQLAAVPLPSPASGFTYTFDSSLGVFQRSTQSFGPILTERAETIGKGKFSFGISYQYFSFDNLEGVDLDAVPAVFTHDDSQLGGGRSDLVTTTNTIGASVNQSVLFLSYGLGSHFDVSVGLPFVTVDIDARSAASVQRVGTSANPATHFLGDPYGTTRTYASSGSASGIGDVLVRLKGSPLRTETSGLALGLDLRAPTGDEEDFLGLGAWGVRPFLAATLSHGRVAPHVNVAYLWNGKSVLGGDVATGEKADLPDQVNYAVGLDIGATRRLTLAFDFLGTYVMDSPRLVRQTFTAANGQAYPQIGFVNESYSLANLAAGFKVNPFGQLLLDFNLLIKLDSAGLRDDVTPLFGIEWAF